MADLARLYSSLPLLETADATRARGTLYCWRLRCGFVQVKREGESTVQIVSVFPAQHIERDFALRLELTHNLSSIAGIKVGNVSFGS
jgi:hypothetical protein